MSAQFGDMWKLPGWTKSYAVAIIAKRPCETRPGVVPMNATPVGSYQTIRKFAAVK